MTQLPDDSNIKPPTEEVKEVKVEQIGMAHDVTSARGNVPLGCILLAVVALLAVLAVAGWFAVTQLGDQDAATETAPAEQPLNAPASPR